LLTRGWPPRRPRHRTRTDRRRRRLEGAEPLEARFLLATTLDVVNEQSGSALNSGVASQRLLSFPSRPSSSEVEPNNDLATATPIAPGAAVAGTTRAADPDFFAIVLDDSGLLSVRLQPTANGPAKHVSLLGPDGGLLVQSDGESDALPVSRIDQHLPGDPAGTTYYLEVQGEGSYALFTDFVAAAPPFQGVPLGFSGSSPEALVSGDFNHDGHADLATANAGSNNVRVLLGSGSGTFTPGDLLPVGRGPQDVIAGDFNGDHILDLITANFGTNDLSLLLGRGDGTFAPEQRIAVPGSPRALVSGDFNGDGQIDLAVADTDTDDVSVLLGHGDGTFAAPQRFPVGWAPYGIVAADFNGDGHLDLATANADSYDVSVLLGRGDGTFAAEQRLAAGAVPDALVAGDFNGDGHIDLVTANFNGDDQTHSVNPDEDSVSLLAGRGDGTFDSQVVFAVGISPRSLVTGDFNHDGRLDLATANSDSNDVSVLLGSDEGTFQNAQSFPVGSIPAGIVAGDFNGDGCVDLATANAAQTSISVLLGRGDASFDSQEVFAGKANPQSLVAGDFNGDGRIDLATVNNSTGDVSVLIGVGDGTFAAGGRFAVGNGPQGIVAGDFNGDGLTDLATANTSSGTVSILLGRGDGTFALEETDDVGQNPTYIVAGDFNGDGHLDLATSNGGSDDVSILTGRGNGTFEGEQRYAAGTSPFALTTGDFNGDGRTDLAVANGDSDNVSVLLNDGHGSFGPSQQIDVDSTPTGIAARDLDGDGHTDLAVTCSDSNTVCVLLGDGSGRFHQALSFPVGVGPQDVVVGDFNHDGHVDLAVVNSGSYDVSVLMGQGGGRFEPQRRYATGLNSSDLVSADFNGDGRLDLATANSGSDDVSILQGLDDGAFTTAQGLTVGSGPEALVSGDFNGDGRPDLATVNRLSNDVSVLLGRGDGTFESGTTFPVGLAPRAIVTGDFNHDGRLDLAVANSGSGDVSVLLGLGDGRFAAEQRSGVGSAPQALVAGDFNGDGLLDLAVANGGSDNVSVLLGLRDGGFESETTYHVGANPFGIVTGDFNGDGRLDLATSNADSADISMLPGHGDGTFGSEQRSRVDLAVTKVVAGDFNGDGVTDLATVDPDENDVAVLRCNGDGTFSVGQLISVGLSPFALVAGDFNGDGRTDLAIENSPATVNVGPDEVLIALGQADGRLTPQRQFPVGVLTLGLAAADFNGDGSLDLASANSASDDVSVLLNLGQGSFAQAAPLQTEVRSTPQVGDLDGDQIPDIVTLDRAGAILFRKGLPGNNGQFDPPTRVNPDPTARAQDIVLVTNRGRATLVAALDSLPSPTPTDGIQRASISFYAAGPEGSLVQAGQVWIPGLTPVRIASADLNGDGYGDLVVALAGSNQVLVFIQDPVIGFTGRSGLLEPTYRLDVGATPSDLALVEGDGAGAGAGRTGPDIVVTNSASGDVSVFRNDPVDPFSTEQRYRAGLGPYGGTATGAGSVVVQSQEQTSGVVADRFDGRLDLAVVDRGTARLELLPGTGTGGFFDPQQASTLPLPSGRSTVISGRFNGDNAPDLVILDSENNTITTLLNDGDGSGRFHPALAEESATTPFLARVAPGSTGIATADLNGDGLLDLLVGDQFGDVLILLGKGDGTFQSYQRTEQRIALALADLKGDGRNELIYADEGRDQVSVDAGTGTGTGPVPIKDSRDHVQAPRGVALADLNADGRPDLVVVNSGGDNVLIYPGLGNGTFGPELNGGDGFFTGTDPVSVTVADANGDGRPDLIVANQGSNDVSILLNQSTGGSLSFSSGPRIQAGLGPSSTALEDLNGDGIPDLMVSDSGSNTATIIPGVGGGFFNDGAARTIPVGPAPGVIEPFPIADHPGFFTINFGSGTGTEVSDPLSASVATRTFLTGGFDPESAFVFDLGNGALGVVIANEGNGVLALLEEGPEGLAVRSTFTKPELPNPTDLAFAGLTGDHVEFYAATEGREAAFLESFDLLVQGSIPSAVLSRPDLPLSPGSGTPLSLAQLVPLHDSSIALAGTLLVLTLEGPLAEAEAAQSEVEATQAQVTSTATGPSMGQSFTTKRQEFDTPGDQDQTDRFDPFSEHEPIKTGKAPLSLWQRRLLKVDEALEQFHFEKSSRPGRGDSSLEDPLEAPAPEDEPGRTAEPGSGPMTTPQRDEETAAIDAIVESLALDRIVRGQDAPAVEPVLDHGANATRERPSESRKPNPGGAILVALVWSCSVGLWLNGSETARFERRAAPGRSARSPGTWLRPRSGRRAGGRRPPGCGPVSK
jgi:hypothetical protein